MTDSKAMTDVKATTDSTLPVSRPRSRSSQKLKSKQNLSMSREDFMAGQLKFVAKELSVWISNVTGRKITDKNLMEELRSGEALCDLLMACDAPPIKGIKRKNNAKSPRSPKALKWIARTNLDLFTKAAVDYGVDPLDIIRPVDLEQGNMKAMCNCLMGIARIATHYGCELPAALEAEVGKRGIGINGLDGKKITLQSLLGDYLGANDGSIRMASTKGKDEMFTLIVNKNETICFKTNEGLYVCRGPDGNLSLSAEFSQDCEFIMGIPTRNLAMQFPGRIAVRTFKDNLYFSSQDSKGMDVFLVKSSEVNQECLFKLRIATDRPKNKKPFGREGDTGFGEEIGDKEGEGEDDNLLIGLRADIKCCGCFCCYRNL
ncbi:hypothetical protein AAMO2058_001381500 [Amorphochlora amoebiformis]